MNTKTEVTARCRSCPHGCYHLTVGPAVIHLSSLDLNGLERSIGSAIAQAAVATSPCCMMLQVADQVCLQLSLEDMLALQQALLSRKPFPCTVH